MNNIIDAHVHFNMKAENPFLDLLSEINENGINVCMLILNTEKEITYFFNNIDIYYKNKERFFISVIFDYKNEKSKIFIDNMRQLKIEFCIKLHPRYTHIIKEDFENILNSIRYVKCNAIIVDCFTHGHYIENHVGIELSIYLARNLPDEKIVIAHSGGIKLLECMMCTRTLSNIYYDISLTANYLSNTSVKIDIINFMAYTSGRIMFGSDRPDFSIKESIKMVESLCSSAKLDEKQINDIFMNNAKKIYGVDYSE